MQPDFDFDLNRRKKDAAAAMVIRSCRRISLMLRAYNPNQLRDEIGRWTYGGGGFGTPDRKPSIGTQIAQGRGGVPPRIPVQPMRRIGGRDFNISPQQQMRLDAAIARANETTARVREREPDWQPKPSVYANVEGEILARESVAYQAEARLYHQARERIQQAIGERSGRGTIEDLFLPRGQELGIQIGGKNRIRAVSRYEFSGLQSWIESRPEILRSDNDFPLTYGGRAYRLIDNSIVGIRESVYSGTTIDVLRSNNPRFNLGYKVHWP
jgi:hypothetical protein